MTGIYEKMMDADGFIYITYTDESTFGDLSEET